MKIYQIKFNYDYSVCDIIATKNGADSLEINSENPGSLKNFEFGWIKEESNKIPDLALVMSQLLLCNSSAKSILSNVLSDFTMNRVIVADQNYYSISDIKQISDILNKKASKIEYFSTGDIMDVITPVFYPIDSPVLFKIKEMESMFFCTEELKTVIERNNLVGWEFKECVTKKKSWF